MRRNCKVFCVCLVVLLALMGLVTTVSAQEPESDVQDAVGRVVAHVPPRPDLQASMQLASERNGSSLSGMSESDASLAFGEFIANKLDPKQYGNGSVNLLDLPVSPGSPIGDHVLVALVDFADLAHGNIPQPSTQNNTDYWVPDFDQDHYNTLMFLRNNEWSLRSYFLEASYEGTATEYDLVGDIHDWTALPIAADIYGNDDTVGVDNYGATTVEDLVEDAADTLSSWTPTDGWAAYSNSFDSAGNPAIDYFIVVHAGKGQEAGGGALGDDAIWTTYGSLDPGDGTGGYQITGTYYVDNYVVVPEDVPVGVLVHMMGRLFGLPETWNPWSSSTVGGENYPYQDLGGVGEASPAFYDPMAQGCWLGRPLGTKPASMTAWERNQLGWLTPVEWNLSMMPASIHLDQIETTSADNQALKIDLPAREYVVPHSGDYMRQAPDRSNYLVDGSNVNTGFLTHTLDIPAGTSASLDYWTWYDLETNYDYGRVWINLGAGATAATITYTGESGGWVAGSLDLSAYAGQTATVTFALEHDNQVDGLGFFLDDFELVVDGSTAWSDDCETSDDGPAQGGSSHVWADTRFPRTMVYTSDHYYLAEWRNDEAGFDRGLREVYNMTNLATGEAEYFEYNPGLLIWYVNPIYRRVDAFWPNGQEADNNVLRHPGEGFLLAVDSHPTPLTKAIDGSAFRTRIQMLDATFRYNPADPQTKPNTVTDEGGMSNNIGALPETSFFWDSLAPDPYWNAGAPYNSVKTVMHGVRLEVEGENANKTGATVRFSIDAGDMSSSTKTVDKATAVPGEVLEYTIILTNTGVADAHTIVVEDEAPAGTSLVGGSLSVAGSPSIVDQSETATGIRFQGTVNLGEPVTITFQVRIDDVVDSGYIENIAYVYEGDVPEADLHAFTWVESAPCLTGSRKTADPENVLAGGYITYTIELINSGSADATATITDVIPSCTSYVAGSLTYDAGTGYYDTLLDAIVWQGPVPVPETPGEPTATIQFIVQVNPGQVDCHLIHNVVQINDGYHAPFEKGADTSVLPGPNMWESTKTVDKTVASPGDQLDYTIYLYNGGNREAEAVVLNDPIPSNTDYVGGSLSATSGTATYNATSGAIEWNGDIDIDSSTTIQFSVMITSPLANGTMITNTATFTEGSDVWVREAGTEVLSEPRLDNLSSKTVQSNSVGYGGVLTYTITLINDGTESATVDLTDNIPSGTEYISGTLDSTSGYTVAYTSTAPARVTGTGTIDAGETVTVTFAVSITLTGTGIITNTAVVDDNVHPPFNLYATSYVGAVGLTAPSVDVYCGDEVVIPVSVDNVDDLQGFQCDVAFDPSIMQIEQIREGTWFSPAAWTIKTYENITGTSTVAATLLAQPTGMSGSGDLYFLHFRTIGSGSGVVTVTYSLLSNTPAPSFTPIPHNTMEPVTVTVSGRDVAGVALMQGRTDHSGVNILLNGALAPTTTAADGSYAFCPPVGLGESFTLTMQKDGYLYGEKLVTVSTTGTLTLANLTLLGGDPIGPQVNVTPPTTCSVTSTMTVAGPPDDRVNILDLTFVGARFGKVSSDPDWGPDVCEPDWLAYRADINEDGDVNIFDLVLVGNNFGSIAPSPWP